MKKIVIITLMLVASMFLLGIKINGSSVSLSSVLSDNIPPFVTVTGSSEEWVKNATASVFCIDLGIITDCDTSSFMLKTSPANFSCPENFSEYDLTNPQEISSHVWVCGAAKDKAGNIGFSPIAIEFRVDQEPPTISNLVAFPESPVNFSENQTYQFNATSTDNILVDSVVLEFDNVNYTDLVKEGDTYSRSFDNLAPKIYTFRWFSKDIAGNWGTTDSQTYTVESVGNETNETETPPQPETQPPQSSEGGASIGFSQSFSLVTPSNISIEQGDYAILTIVVRNNGPSYANITVITENLPDSWVQINPPSKVVDASSFEEFLINVSIPREEAVGERSFSIIAKDGVEARRPVNLMITEEETVSPVSQIPVAENVTATNLTQTNVSQPPSPVGAFILTDPSFIGGMIALIFISVLLYLYYYRKEDFMQLKNFFKTTSPKINKAEIEVIDSGETVKYTVTYED